MHHYYALLINIMRVRGKGGPQLISQRPPPDLPKGEEKGHRQRSRAPLLASPRGGKS